MVSFASTCLLGMGPRFSNVGDQRRHGESRSRKGATTRKYSRRQIRSLFSHCPGKFHAASLPNLPAHHLPPHRSSLNNKHISKCACVVTPNQPTTQALPCPRSTSPAASCTLQDRSIPQSITIERDQQTTRPHNKKSTGAGKLYRVITPVLSLYCG